MELTRREQRLLSRKYNVAILWIGVALIAFSIAVPILALVRWREADSVWQRHISEIEGLSASGTDTERMLKRLLTANAKSLRDLDRKRVDEMAQKGFIMFAFPGIMCIGLHFRTRVYQRIFERLRPLDQTNLPSSPE